MPSNYRRLPFAIRPGHMESLESFTERLQRANRISPTTWRAWLTAELGSATVSDDELAPFVETVAGIRPGHFVRQAQHLPAHENGTTCGNCTTGIKERAACLRCARGDVVQQLPHDGARICRKHRQWVGPGPDGQYTVGLEAMKADRMYAKLRRMGLIDAHRIAELTECVSEWARAELAEEQSSADQFTMSVRLAIVITGGQWTAENSTGASRTANRYALLTALVGSIAGSRPTTVLVDSLWTLLRGADHQDNTGPHAFQRAQASVPARDSLDGHMRSSAYPRSRHLHFAQYLSSDASGTRGERWARQHMECRYLCHRGHRFDVKPVLLTRAVVNGCAYCANRRPLPGFNTLQDLHPDLAAEWHLEANGVLRPSDVLPGSQTVVAWSCANGHTFHTSPRERTGRNVGCGYCANWLVDPKTNSLAVVRPDIAATWHATLNGDLTPHDVVLKSERKAWFTCDAGHNFKQKIASRTAGRQCPYCCRLLAHPSTCLAATHPEVASLWHVSKNAALTPQDVLAGSRRKVWWHCSENSGHDHVTSILNKANGHGCALCSGRAVNGTNSMRATHPALAAEFHPTKNGNLTPDNTLSSSGATFWWRCSNAHEWEAQSRTRARSGGSCSFCANRRVWVGWNDMRTTHPGLAEQLHPSRNGDLKPEDVVAGSNLMLWWRCGCGHEWQAKPNHRVRGALCPRCKGRTTR